MSQRTMRAAAAAQDKRRRQRCDKRIKCGEHRGYLVVTWRSSVCEMRVYHLPTHAQPWWVTDGLPQIYCKCLSREEAEHEAKEMLRCGTLDILHQHECLRDI